MPSVKILFDLRPMQSGKISGVETFTQNFLRSCVKQFPQHDFFLWANSHRPLPQNFKESLQDIFKKENVRLLQTRIPNKILNFALALLRWPKLDTFLARRFGVGKFDCMFLPDLRPAPVSRCRKICFAHDLAFVHFRETFSHRSRIWFALSRPKKELAESWRIFCPSACTKKDLQETFHLQHKKIHFAHLGVCQHFFKKIPKVTLQDFRARKGLPRNFALSLCTLQKRKNLPTLLAAFGQFAARFPQEDLHLVVAGQANETIFASEDLPKSPRVIFTGEIPESEKSLLLQSAKFFVLPSLWEGFGLPILEAAASGLPVLVSDLPVFREFAGKFATFFAPSDPADLCQKMAQLWLDRNLQKEMAASSRRCAREFSWDRCAREIFKKIES